VGAYVRLADWRASLRTYGPKKGPCATCNVDEYESTPMMEMLSRFLTHSDSVAVGLIKNGLRPDHSQATPAKKMSRHLSVAKTPARESPRISVVVWSITIGAAEELPGWTCCTGWRT
jgi:hypothetical protein